MMDRMTCTAADAASTWPGYRAYARTGADTIASMSSVASLSFVT